VLAELTIMVRHVWSFSKIAKRLPTAAEKEFTDLHYFFYHTFRLLLSVGFREKFRQGWGYKVCDSFTKNCKLCYNYSFASCILMVSTDGCKHLCILCDTHCLNRGTVNHQSKPLIYKMPKATRSCVCALCAASVSQHFWNLFSGVSIAQAQSRTYIY
jgi:hypothetical protein